MYPISRPNTTLRTSSFVQKSNTTFSSFKPNQFRSYNGVPQHFVVPSQEPPVNIPDHSNLFATRPLSFREYLNDTRQALHEIQHSAPLMAPPVRKRNTKKKINYKKMPQQQEEDELGKEEHHNIILGSWLDSFK